MEMQRQAIDNTYERLAINLSELIYDLDIEQEILLRDLLTKAYNVAYMKAVTEIEDVSAVVND